MSVRPDTGQKVQACISEEIDLTSRFTRMLIEDESIFEERPAGATVFPCPEGDAEREAESRQSADRFAQGGKPSASVAFPPLNRGLPKNPGSTSTPIAEWHRVEDGW